MKFTGICTKKEAFTGATIQKDFLADNCHKLQFTKIGKSIGVSIAGFSVNYFFYFNPKGKQIRINEYFINRYVLQCDNASEILQYFK